MSAASSFNALDEIWERFLALDEMELSASIRKCALYLASPEGVAEFGRPLRSENRSLNIECSSARDREAGRNG
jgi:hypothetical protein